jgi:integrase
MSNFIENVLDDDYPEFKNIVNKIPAPDKVEVREKTIMTEEQVQYLLDYLVENKKYQHACALALALSSGARKSELLRFKVSYFVDENIIYGSLYKTPEKIKTKGRSSKGKLLTKYTLVKRFKPYFDLWMKQREELGITGDELFWVHRKGEWKHADVPTLNSFALTFSKILNCDFYFHSCRHFWTTYLSESGLPAEVIKKISGWESVSMVSIYTDTDVDDELGKYFSEDGIVAQEKKSLSDL